MAAVFWILSAGAFIWVSWTYAAAKSPGHEIEALIMLLATVFATSGWVVTTLEELRTWATGPAPEQADTPASHERADPAPTRTDSFPPLAIASIVLLVAAAVVYGFLLEPRR